MNSPAESNATPFARRERERRFVLSGPAPGAAVRQVKITDRYILGSRLRLRQSVLVDGRGDDVVYKLTQKLPAPEGPFEMITSIYLTKDEYETIAKLPARELEKTRSSVPPLGIDCFEGDLRGLIMAEAEFETDAAMHDFAPPPFAVAEVTLDPRFTGGYLVSASREDVQATLTEFGIALSPSTKPHPGRSDIPPR